jgi:hypothetical protein
MIKLDPGNCIRVVNNGDDLWTAIERYMFDSKYGYTIVIEVGEESDGASVPRILWAEIPPFGLHFNAAFVHDHLYREPDPAKKLPKEICDKIFLEIMERDGVPLARRLAMYDAVVTMGYTSYTHGKVAAAALLAAEDERSIA